MKLTKFDKIHYYEDVIYKPYALIKEIEETDEILNNTSSITKWSQWRASDNSYDFGYQKIITQSIETESNERLLNIASTIKNAITVASEDYAKEYNIDLGYLTPISISKYSTGKEMGPHVDSYEDGRSPVLSVVLYLNDNYNGGELYFNEQDVLIKPTAGSLIAFPSVAPYYHQSKIITKGLKYMSPGFWYKD